MPGVPKICVIGSVNLDFIIQTSTLPQAGETVGGGTFSTSPGGKGANIALMLHRLGAEVWLNGCVGHDMYADMALSVLLADGVDLSRVQCLEGQSTGVAFVNVATQDGENQIAVAAGANSGFLPEFIQAQSADALITQFEIPIETVQMALQNFKGFRCVNASPTGANILPLLTYIDLLIVNRSEFTAYEDALKNYQGWLAVTDGASDACLFQARQLIARATPPSVTVMDTTGAGDGFAAALVVAFQEQKAPQEALEFACHVGALCTTRLGAQAAMPYRQELFDGSEKN